MPAAASPPKARLRFSPPSDIRQATVRIADSLFQYNNAETNETADDADPDRDGRGDIREPGVIYVRFAQPVIVNNVFLDNHDALSGGDDAAAISADVNSLNYLNVADWGRSTAQRTLSCNTRTTPARWCATTAWRTTTSTAWWSAAER